MPIARVTSPTAAKSQPKSLSTSGVTVAPRTSVSSVHSAVDTKVTQKTIEIPALEQFSSVEDFYDDDSDDSCADSETSLHDSGDPSPLDCDQARSSDHLGTREASESPEALPASQTSRRGVHESGSELLQVNPELSVPICIKEISHGGCTAKRKACLSVSAKYPQVPPSKASVPIRAAPTTKVTYFVSDATTSAESPNLKRKIQFAPTDLPKLSKIKCSGGEPRHRESISKVQLEIESPNA
jgi:hypothetical protein